MTNKEASTMLKSIRELFSVSYSPESIAALSKAIDLLEQIPDEHGDLVDKETAKNAFDSSFLTFHMKDGETMRGFYQRTIDELPVIIAAERRESV